MVSSPENPGMNSPPVNGLGSEKACKDSCTTGVSIKNKIRGRECDLELRNLFQVINTNLAASRILSSS